VKLFSSRKKSVPSRRLADREPHARSDDLPSSQFRRNRTLSGIARETPEVSSRARVHHLARQRRKVGSMLLLILIGIGLLALLLTQMTAKVIITSASTSVSNSIDGAVYEEVINDYLGIHPAERLRFILNEQELSNYVAAVVPEVASVDQTGSENIVETRFSITFRKPIAGWQINNRQFYVDDHGIVFEKNYYSAPTVQIIDESGLSPEQGSTVASARFLSFVGRVVGLSKDRGYEVTEAILPSGTTRQLEIRINGVAPRVKLSIDRGAGEQVEDMARALNYLSQRGQNPGYVDVRVSGRAVYQ
jgi:hypothetical protein